MRHPQAASRRRARAVAATATQVPLLPAVTGLLLILAAALLLHIG